MHIRILDLDGSLSSQKELTARHQPAQYGHQEWGPCIRLACSFGRFRRFEEALTACLGSDSDAQPTLTLYGSGDFHHLSLALLRRVQTPINLLVLDNHPDWMRGVPFLHCGTWLYHAARLPQVERIFHVGGDVDFDNYYQWMAPWRWLHSGKITVLPGYRRYQRGSWSRIPHEPLRNQSDSPASAVRVAELLHPFRAELARRPLYISLDKDVMGASEAVVNWDSGHLVLSEVCAILETFLEAAQFDLTGMDIVGDWSPVRCRGWLRHLMHVTMHPALAVDAALATRVNQHTNLALLECVLPQRRLEMPSSISRRSCGKV
jgi:hypothetical protein